MSDQSVSVPTSSSSTATGAAVLLGAATAFIHFYLVPAEFNKGATGYGTPA
jgi:hypothetical protein